MFRLFGSKKERKDGQASPEGLTKLIYVDFFFPRILDTWGGVRKWFLGKMYLCLYYYRSRRLRPRREGGCWRFHWASSQVGDDLECWCGEGKWGKNLSILFFFSIFEVTEGVMIGFFAHFAFYRVSQKNALSEPWQPVCTSIRTQNGFQILFANTTSNMGAPLSSEISFEIKVACKWRTVWHCYHSLQSHVVVTIHHKLWFTTSLHVTVITADLLLAPPPCLLVKVLQLTGSMFIGGGIAARERKSKKLRKWF